MTMLRQSSPKGLHRQRGLAMVELAILLPVIMLIMLMTAEFGRVFYQYTTLDKAVRDGARHAAGTAIFGSTGTVQLTGAVISETQSLVATGSTTGGTALLPGLTAADVTLTNAGPGNIRVTATYGFQPIFATLPGFGATGNRGLSFTLTASSVMRVL
jgi:Flp pilus assembly protein TadG